MNDMAAEYVTLVFLNKTAGDKKFIREISQKKSCRAWSLDHEILRADLMRDALEKNEIDRAKQYADADDVYRFRGDLFKYNVYKLGKT